MRILLTNDDGYRARGINVVFNALIEAGHDVVIVAPELNSSGAGQSITVYDPISIHKDSDRIYYVTSTPADSVRLGLQVAYETRANYPDLVISGVNMGENVSEDILYSGTVGAAREAALHGIPALAFSTPGPSFEYLDAAATIVVRLVQCLEQHNREIFSSVFLWNINIPSRPLSEIGGFEATKLGSRQEHLPFQKQITPRGNTIYWQGMSGKADISELGTDVAVAAMGHNVSITPLAVLPTDYTQMPIISALAI